MDQPEAPQPIRQCDAERVIFRKLKALYDGNHKEHCWHILNRVIPPELFSGLGLRAKQPGPLPSKKKSQPNSDSAPSGSGYSGTGPPSKLFKNKKGKAVKPVAVEIPPDQNDPISLIITRSVSWPTNRKRNFKRLVRGSGSLSRRKRTLMTVSPFKPFTK